MPIGVNLSNITDHKINEWKHERRLIERLIAVGYTCTQINVEELINIIEELANEVQLLKDTDSLIRSAHDEIDHYARLYSETKHKNTQLEKNIRQLTVALESFGDHTEDCNIYSTLESGRILDNEASKCDCGWSALSQEAPK